MLERRLNPESDTVGDIRVRYFTHRSFIEEGERVHVSILGRQKGETLSFDQGLIMKIGQDKSLNELIEDEEKYIKNSMWRIRLVTALCTCFFLYSILANNLFNIYLEIPELGL